MSQIHPFAGAIAQTPQVQRLAAQERDTQLRKAAERARTTGFDDQPHDEFVESADTVPAVGEDAHHDDPRRRKRSRTPDEQAPPPDDDQPRLDVRA